ncbi:ABC-type nitrate/sulfonate/bicarbonate transport system ATPase subunit [Paraburkholderia atlantica]
MTTTGSEGIRIRGVSNRYARQRDADDDLLVLDDISLNIAAGEFISVLGASGCGKSTLLRLAAGLDTDYRGEISVDGERVRDTSLERGIVFSGSAAISVAYSLAEYSRRAAQRAAFATAEARRGVRARRTRRLQGFEHSERITIMLVTHDVDEAIHLGDRVVAMAPRPGPLRAARAHAALSVLTERIGLLAAQTAEVIFVAHQTLDEARQFYRDVKGRLARYGRAPEHLKIIPGIFPVIGKTQQEARDKFDALQEFIDPAVRLALLSTRVIRHRPADMVE